MPFEAAACIECNTLIIDANMHQTILLAGFNCKCYFFLPKAGKLNAKLVLFCNTKFVKI